MYAMGDTDACWSRLTTLESALQERLTALQELVAPGPVVDAALADVRQALQALDAALRDAAVTVATLPAPLEVRQRAGRRDVHSSCPAPLAAAGTGTTGGARGGDFGVARAAASAQASSAPKCGAPSGQRAGCAARRGEWGARASDGTA